VRTCTTAFDPITSSTWPRRLVPSGRIKLTMSANMGFCKGTRGRRCTKGARRGLKRQGPDARLNMVKNDKRPTNCLDGPVICEKNARRIGTTQGHRALPELSDERTNPRLNGVFGSIRLIALGRHLGEDSTFGAPPSLV
jgi:hypothetical protein